MILLLPLSTLPLGKMGTSKQITLKEKAAHKRPLRELVFDTITKYGTGSYLKSQLVVLVDKETV